MENFSSSDSTDSSISTKAIQTFVDKLKNERNRSSTRKTYYAIWRIFNEFFIKLDQKPESWEDRLTLFVGYMVSKRRKASTISSYISAIKAVLIEDGVKLNENKYLLTSLTQACRYHNNSVKTRLPIGKSMLAILIDQTAQYFLNANQVYLATLYKALFKASYFGLLRVSEVTSGAHPVLGKDVHIAQNKRKVLFILRTSQTHWTDSKPQLVGISSKLERQQNGEVKYRGSPLIICPYSILRQYVKERPPRVGNDEPFFIFGDRTPVTPSHMKKTLKFLLTLSGFDAHLYSIHSLRIGRCMDLLKMQVHVDLIRKLGRWQSNCVYRYLANV